MRLLKLHLCTPLAFTMMAVILTLLNTSCTSPEQADMMVIGKKIYAPIALEANALVIRGDSIIAIGDAAVLQKEYKATTVVNRPEAFIYPGFIDAHCHFLGYGEASFGADLVATTSFEEVINRLVAFDKEFDPEWLYGRGWDQNDWEIKEYPDRAVLDSLFPDKPVLIKRIDGHAALVNQKALEIAGVDIQTEIDGGEFQVISNRLTGIVIDNAETMLSNKMPEADATQIRNYLKKAEQDCFAVGLTTVDDAGLEKHEVETIGEMQEQGELQMRVYAMLNPTEENFTWMHYRGPIKDKRLTVNAFKIYADGSLGSRGARLKEDYHDMEGHQGLWVNDSAYFDSVARVINKLGMQMNTHCIGDAANEMILNTYRRVIFDEDYVRSVLSNNETIKQKVKELKNHRWRIEHAQVVDPEDIKLFGQYGIIPSVQATHATSDMYWAAERIGSSRMDGAYAYQSLLNSYGMIAMGSDFPVESINPLYGFYAAVSRKDHKGWPDDGFWKEEAINRDQALMAMTIWAAYANFEDKVKGSLEVGKLADIVILEEDIMTIEESKIPMVKVLETILGGKSVYQINEAP